MNHTLDIRNASIAPAVAIEIVSEPGASIRRISIVGQPVAPLVVMRRFHRWCGVVLDGFVPGVGENPLPLCVETTSSAAPGWCVVHDSPEHGAWEPQTLLEPPIPRPVAWMTLATLEARSILCAPTAEEETWARYFRELDLKTNPVLLQERGRATGCPRFQPFESLVGAIGGELMERLHARVAGTPMPPFPPRCELVLLSALQVDLLARYFGHAEGRDCGSRIARVFASFAAAGLLLDVRAARHAEAERARSRSSNGGPNSAFVFLFAEFAAAAIEAQVDAAVWSRLLPSLVTAAEIYLWCYGDRNGGRAVPREVGWYSDQPHRSVEPEELDRLLARYTGEGVDGAMRRLTATAKAALLAEGWSNGGGVIRHPDGCWFDGGSVEFAGP